MVMLGWRRGDGVHTGADAWPSISKLSSLRMFLSTAPSPLPMAAAGARPREPAPERGASGPAVPRAASELLPGASGRAPDDCEAFRALAATRRRLPAAKKAARQRQACGQSTALIWFGLLACLASVREGAAERWLR